VADTTLWLPLGTAVIAACAALAGNALGPMLGAQREHSQWLRNKRAELLETFHALLDEAEHDASRRCIELALPSPQVDDPEAREARSTDLFERLTSASARAELYTSPRLAELMSTVAYDFQVVYSSPGTYNHDKRTEVHRSWLADCHECTRVIREELRVESA
jgi:hypothetical protein